MKTEDKRQLVLDIIQELLLKEDGAWPTCDEIRVEYRRQTGDNVSVATVRKHIKALEDEGCIRSLKLGNEKLFAIVGRKEPE